MSAQNRYINCPNCGHNIPIENRTGRKSLNIAVNNVYDALRLHRSVLTAAEKLGCSRAYIYMELAKHGTTPREVMQRK